VRPPFFDVVAHRPVPRLLERPERSSVLDVDPGDGGDRGGRREHDLTGEGPQRGRPDAVADHLRLADQEIDAGDARADLYEGLVVGMVGDEVGLDHPDRRPCEHDQVMVGRVAAFERRAIVSVDVVLVVPPAADVLLLEPTAEQRQIPEHHGAEGDVRMLDRCQAAIRRRSIASACSSRTFKSRQRMR
jgi:hypothetical protein